MPAFASVISAITASDATRRVTRSARREPGGLDQALFRGGERDGTSSRIASAGTTQRATEKAPALVGPVMNFPGSVA